MVKFFVFTTWYIVCVLLRLKYGFMRLANQCILFLFTFSHDVPSFLELSCYTKLSINNIHVVTDSFRFDFYCFWKDNSKNSENMLPPLHIYHIYLIFEPSSVFFHPQCSFLPKFSIHIETKYEDNKGCNDNVSIDWKRCWCGRTFENLRYKLEVQLWPWCSLEGKLCLII